MGQRRNSLSMVCVTIVRFEEFSLIAATVFFVFRLFNAVGIKSHHSPFPAASMAANAGQRP